MSDILNNKGNAVIFYEDGNDPDYSINWPNIYNMRIRQNYLPGIYSTPFYREHVINNPMYLQFGILNQMINTDINVFKYNPITDSFDLYDTLTLSDISPAGWVSYVVGSYVFTPTEEGIYYYTFPGAGYTSDHFVVDNDLKYRKRLVEIEYSNSVNDYGLVFVDSGVNVWKGLVYFTGTPLPTIGNTINGFVPDRGGFRKNRSTPTEGLNLTISATNSEYLSLLNIIFSCNNLKVNGVYYENPEPLAMERILKSDNSTFVTELIESQTSYYTR